MPDTKLSQKPADDFDLIKATPDQIKKLQKDPLGSLGPASTQLAPDWPRAKIEYLRDGSTKKSHPDWQSGLFTLSTEIQKDHLLGVLLCMRYGRIYWPIPFNPDSPPDKPWCRSQDGVHHDKSILTQLPPFCVSISPEGKPYTDPSGRYIPECSYATWKEDGKPPDCKEVFSLLLWETEEKCPVIFDVKSTGIKSLRQFKNSLASTGASMRHGQLPIPCCCLVKITIRDKGIYFIPVFNIVEQVSREDAIKYTQYSIDFSALFNRVDIADVKDKEENK